MRSHDWNAEYAPECKSGKHSTRSHNSSRVVKTSSDTNKCMWMHVACVKQCRYLTCRQSKKMRVNVFEMWELLKLLSRSVGRGRRVGAKIEIDLPGKLVVLFGVRVQKLCDLRILRQTPVCLSNSNPSCSRSFIFCLLQRIFVGCVLAQTVYEYIDLRINRCDLIGLTYNELSEEIPRLEP